MSISNNLRRLLAVPGAKNLSRNVIFAAAETLATTATLFIIFRLIVSRLGLDALGVWSIVIASTSFARLGDFGVAAGVSRYVAQFLAAGDERSATEVIEVATIATCCLYITIALVAYGPVWFVLGVMLDGSALSDARSLLPYAFSSLGITSIAGTLLSGLIGREVSYIKSSIVTISNALLLGFTVLMIGPMGITGVALAQNIQAICLSFLAYISLKSRKVALFQTLRRLNMDILRSLFKYGANVQVSTVAVSLFEPLTKLIMAHIAGPAAVGIYEVASRVVLQGRSVLFAINQTFVPTFSRLFELGSNILSSSFSAVSKRNAAIVLLLSIAVVSASPVLSYIVFSRLDWTFIAFVFILNIGWSLNSLLMPAYILGMGLGELKFNTLSQVAIALLSPMLAYAGGTLFGAMGIVIGAMCALGVGTGVLLLGSGRLMRKINVRCAREES